MRWYPRLRRRKVKLGRSKIQGRGVFALRVIQRGEIIYDRCVGKIGYNHSCEPNVVLTRGYREQLAVVIRKLARGEELTVDYRITGRHRLTHGIKKCNCPKCGRMKR